MFIIIILPPILLSGIIKFNKFTIYSLIKYNIICCYFLKTIKYNIDIKAYNNNI